MSTLHYDVPATIGEKSILARAAAMTEYVWKPAGGVAKNARKFFEPLRDGSLYDGEPQHGVPYSSARVCDHFVGIDMPLDTLTSLSADPHSLLYSRDNGAFDDDAYRCMIRNTFLYCGIVCSGFVNFCLALPLHRSTHEWGTSPEFTPVETSVQAMRLCDTMVTTRADGSTGGHVKIVTAIGRDDDGRVCEVEISESIVPLTVRRTYTAEQVEAMFTAPADHYRVFRYCNRDTVPPPPASRLEENETLRLDHGAFSNIREGEPLAFTLPYADGSVTVSGLAHHFTYTVKGLPVLEDGLRLLTIPSLPPDEYIARAVCSEEASNAVSFTVVRPATVTLRANGQPIPRAALLLCEGSGAPLTPASPELRGEDGALKETAVLHVTDGAKIYPINAALREQDGRIVARPCALFTDAQGLPLLRTIVGTGQPLYCLAAPENSVITAEFTGSCCCVPSYLSWKDEGYISYCQRLLTPDEIDARTCATVLLRHNSDFTHFSIFSRNATGRVSSQPQLFLIR